MSVFSKNTRHYYPHKEIHLPVLRMQKHLQTAGRGHVVAVVLASTTCIPCIATAGEQSERPARLPGHVLETSSCKSVTLTSFFRACLLRFRRKLSPQTVQMTRVASPWQMSIILYFFHLTTLFYPFGTKRTFLSVLSQASDVFLVTFRVCSQSETSPSWKHDGKTTSTKPQSNGKE